jgi:PAS domain S-box-containing protein
LVFKNSKNDDNDLRRQFEEDPFKTNELNESIIQNAHVLLIVLDKTGNILIWNRAAEVISGYSKEEVLHRNLIWKQLYPDKEYRDQVTKKIFDIIDKNDFFENLETIIQTKSGQSRVIEWNTQKIKSKTNGYITFIAIGRDITGQKNAVEALHQSEEKFRTFADYTYDWEYWVLPDNTILYTSPSCERITGYTPDEFYKNPELMDEIIIPEDQDARARHMNQIFVSTEPKSVDYRIRHRNGEVRWIAHICQPVYNKKKELVGRRSSNRDITERKQIEEALKESEEMFRNPVEHSPVGVYLSQDDIIIYSNPKFAEMLGYTRNEMSNKSFEQLVFADDLQKVREATSELVNNKQGAGYVQFRGVKKDGTIIDLEEYGSSMIFQHRPARYGTIIDITKHKQAEEALRESETRYRNLFVSSSDAIMTLEPPLWRFTSSNPATVQMFMASDEAEFTSKEPWVLSPERQPDGRDSGDKAKEMIETALRDGTHFFEWTHRRLNGEDFPATVLLSRVALAGKVFLQATVRDITEQKKLEEALNTTAREWETTFNATSDGICLIDADQKIQRCNIRMSEILGGIPQEEVVGMPCWAIVHKTTGPIPECPFVSAKETLHRTTIEIPAGDLWFEVTADPILDSSGKFTGAVHIMREITERKQAEEALRESEQKYHDIIDNATDLIQSVTPEGKIIYVNQAWMKTLGYSETDIPHLSLKDIIHPDSLSHCMVAFKRLLSGENIGTIEAVFITKDGKKISVEGNVNCRFINGKPAYTRGIFRDITERKQMEDQIAKSLKEKEMLLKEIHHRVKNNMQVISSLLYMQAKTLKDETVKDILRESQNRIKSIALVHEKLYQSTDLDRIDYSDYLRKITDHLFESYQVDPNIIKLQLNLENVFMHINKAVPCSLILNEMISNSLKHAFPKGRKGVITIDIRKKADMYMLIYSDDGIGIPEGITFERTESLGMQLIYGLVEQISGSIELERKGGTRYTITFPV